ncbi:MAG: hypothetical protein ACLQHK_04875 [Gallionellaceae bacterium]
MNIFEKNEFLAVTLLSMLLCAMPFFVVDWLPMTDLPQHLAQAHLVGKVLSGDRPDMLINWLSPDTLTTWVLALLLLVLPPLLAAKAMVLGLILLSILGIALLARKIGASVIVVPLSAALLFNQSFYWGFLPFIAGFPPFLFLIVAWYGMSRVSWREIIFLALLFLLVYFCHILWLAVALLAVLLIALASPEWNMKLRAMVLSALPAVGLALFWFPSIHNNWINNGFDMAPYWTVSWVGRLRPDYAAFAISGLKSDFNLLLLLTTFSFVLAGIVRAMARGRRIVSAPLLVFATIMLAAYLLVPDRYNNTILFAVRWLPYVLIVFLLGCLAPIRVAKWRIGISLFACIVLGNYALLTAYTWNNMEKEEWSGLMQAMEKLPPKQTVLGLDFIRKSARINTAFPFAANAAYAQAFKDCEVNFSFAEQPTSLVTYKTIPIRPYKRSLHIFSQMVNRTDVGFFNFVLVNADEVTHDKLAEFLGITPVTHEGRWRLYEVGRSN